MMSQLSLARPVGSGVRVPGGLPPVAPGLAAAVSSCQSRVTVTGTDQLEYMILSGHCRPGHAAAAARIWVKFVLPSRTAGK